MVFNRGWRGAAARETLSLSLSLSPHSHRVQLLVNGRHVVQIRHQLADEGAVGEDEDFGGL